MKRIFSLLLVAAMLFSFAACGNEQTPSTGDTQGAANTTNYDYNPSNLESMLSFITTTGEAACTDTETEAATLIGVLGDSFDSYDVNKTKVTAFFENMQARSADLYAAFQSCSIDYFKCVAKQGLDDYDAWDDAMANEYTAMMMQYLETMTALQEIDEDTLSDEEALYYAEVMLRINQKLLEVA